MLEMETDPVESLIFTWVCAIYNNKSSLSKFNSLISNERKKNMSTIIEVNNFE